MINVIEIFIFLYVLLLSSYIAWRKLHPPASIAKYFEIRKHLLGRRSIHQRKMILSGDTCAQKKADFLKQARELYKQLPPGKYTAVTHPQALRLIAVYSKGEGNIKITVGKDVPRRSIYRIQAIMYGCGSCCAGLSESGKPKCKYIAADNVKFKKIKVTKH